MAFALVLAVVLGACAPGLPDRFASPANAAVLALAQDGDAEAQAALGLIYEQGGGGPPDHDAAIRWYRRAARQGNALAAFRLGQMHEAGRGTARDYAKAARWYGRAAEGGDSAAAYRLGVLHEHGLGVPRDTTRAALWYQRAASGWSQGVAPPLAASHVVIDPAAGSAPADAVRAARAHLASLRTADEALDAWARLRDAHADALGGLQLVVVELDLGADAGLFYQVQAGPFADDAAAEAACAALNARGQFCQPVPAR